MPSQFRLSAVRYRTLWTVNCTTTAPSTRLRATTWDVITATDSGSRASNQTVRFTVVCTIANAQSAFYAYRYDYSCSSANADGPRDAVTHNHPSRCTQSWMLTVINRWRSSSTVDSSWPSPTSSPGVVNTERRLSVVSVCMINKARLLTSFIDNTKRSTVSMPWWNFLKCRDIRAIMGHMSLTTPPFRGDLSIHYDFLWLISVPNLLQKIHCVSTVELRLCPEM